MKLGDSSTARVAEVATLWPAATAGVFWFDGRVPFDLIHFLVLIVSGGISYGYLVRVRRTHRRDGSSVESTPGEVNALYLLSEGTLFDFVEAWRPRYASALPRRTRSIVVVLTSLSIVVPSFLWLWFRASRHVVTAPEPNGTVVALGILPYLLVGVLLGSAMLSRDEDDVDG